MQAVNLLTDAEGKRYLGEHRGTSGGVGPEQFHRGRTMKIRRLGDEDACRLELGADQFNEAEEIARVQVLDEVRAKDRTDAAIRDAS